MCTHVQLLQLLRDRSTLDLLKFRSARSTRIRNIKIHFQLVNVEVRNRPEILKFITKYRLHVSMHMRLSFQRLRNAPIKSSFYHTRTCLPLPCFFQGSVVYAAIYTSPQVFSTKFRAIPGTEYPI